VVAVFLTSGELGLPDSAQEDARRVREREAEEAAGILGISSLMFMRRPDQHLADEIGNVTDALKPVLELEKPETIYLTHERDFHPDHRATAKIVRTALQGSGIPTPALLSYEVLTPLTEYDRAEDISPVIERKLRAVCAHGSQVRLFRYDRAVRALNEYRGIVA